MCEKLNLLYVHGLTMHLNLFGSAAEKKKDGKKKRVHFADDVVDPIGNGEDYRKKMLLRYKNKLKMDPKTMAK